ncbi:unnamed protein product [Rotaria sordida]|uniref:RING-type domain-containing protein n=1 Tax=Rotaria sordida TaxID=392033 RepID=A0A813ZY44_9BILA|nr:unnamed protein product [Rotaria sordida]
MASEQRRYGDKNRKQNIRNNATSGLPKEPSDLSTFDKLMMYFTKTNPEYSISDFTEALYAYRQERQTLAGLSLSQIEEGVLNIVRSKYPSKQNDIDTAHTENSTEDKTEQSVAAALWNTFKRYREREQLPKKAEKNTTNKNDETVAIEDQCLICLENLSLNKTETFPCNHTFHRMCLEEWFKIERTCPLCRQGKGHVNRQRRQVVDGNNLNTGILSRNSDRLISSNNVQFIPSNNPNMALSNDRQNQQQSNNNLLPSSQGQAPPVRSRGFYDSPAFKPPSFNGEKPVGWFDTKYPNWVSNQDGQLNQNNMVNGKNAPSSLQGKAFQPSREDGGPALLQKIAKHYASKGEKTYNFGHHPNEPGRGSICINRHNYNGYTFGKFQCPLPPNIGMNQLDRYCCGPESYQYCCNEQEYNQQQNNRYDNDRHSRHYHYSRTINRTLFIILPLIGILVIAGGGFIIFSYYKKVQKENNKQSKSSGITRLNDNYSAVPQDASVERPIVNQHEQQNTSVQA